MKLPYREGTWFAVPLRDSGFGVGVVARSAKKGKLLLCYFFGPRRNVPPNLSEVGKLSPSDAVMIRMVGDLGLIRREWPIIGEHPSWNRKLWPMPPFVRRDPITGDAWRVYYSDDDPFEVLREEPEPQDSKLESHGLLGYGAAEILLTNRLNQPSKGE